MKISFINVKHVKWRGWEKSPPNRKLNKICKSFMFRLTACVTSQQRMRIPPRHLIIPYHFRGSCCLSLNLYFDSWIFEMAESWLLSSFYFTMMNKRSLSFRYKDQITEWYIFGLLFNVFFCILDCFYESNNIIMILGSWF